MRRPGRNRVTQAGAPYYRTLGELRLELGLTLRNLQQRSGLDKATLSQIERGRGMRDAHPLQVFGRLLTCTTCRAHVDLIELPEPWIDGDSYQCGECMRPLALETPRDRILNGTYDPRTEPIPF